jgi:hypothetical protein
MPARKIMIDGVELLVEVDPEMPADRSLVERSVGGTNQERGALSDKVRDVGQDLRNVLATVTKPIRDALEASQPEEWGIELSLGFKGEAGIPFLTKGEANGTIKVTAKWKQSLPASPK